MAKIIKENTFEGGPGGKSGTLNYGQKYGTPSGGDAVQNPKHFGSSEDDLKNFVPNTTLGSSSPQTPPPEGQRDSDGTTMRTPDDSGKINNQALNQTKSPFDNAEKQIADKPLDPDKSFDPQVDQLFQKKQTPSPDEVMSGLQFELSNMTKKDKTIAKQIVLKNFRKDPHYYSNLNMLNIDDDKMTVDENSTVAKTKAVLDEMIASRQRNRPVAVSPEITRIFKDLIDKRRSIKR